MIETNIIVMKFGGTSVATKEARDRVARHILREVESGFKVLVVVSAMGRLGAPYATDTLNDLTSPALSPCERDRLLSCGEVISSIVTSDVARAHGISVMSLAPYELGIITDHHHGDARILKVNEQVLLEKFSRYDVLIAPGFIGMSQDFKLTTLGRGGSDTSAIALGAALDADYVDIYSDVPGVMSADPKSDKNAQLLCELNYDKLVDLAEAGAKVISPQAAMLAKDKGVVLRFRSTFKETVGTVVKNDD